MITVTVDTRRAAVTSKELLTVGSLGIEIEYVLSEDWDDLVKVAVFRSGEEGTAYAVVLSDTLTTEVPSACLTEDYEGEPLFVGVYGADGDGTIVIPTIWASAGAIRPSVSSSVTESPPESETTNWSEAVAQIEAYNTEASGYATAAAASAAAAAESESNASDSETNAASSEANAAQSETNAATSEANALTYANNASTSETNAAESESNAEAWAVGTRDGVAVDSTDETYNNNAKHYAEVAQQGAETSGYAFFSIDESDGEMYVTVTDNIADDVSFAIDTSTGELEVTVNG